MNDINAYEKSLRAHYGRADLSQALFAALDKAGKKITSYQDSAAFDEFHMRGREATLELAHLANIQPGRRVLDLGCGVGGPSRLLAAEFGCRVTGIDLVEEFIQLATLLTRKVGLEGKVSFQQGSMLNLPFDPNCFDVAWSQHAFMNIEDKCRLLDQIRKVLKPNGLLALYEILRGEIAPIQYPVQWAGDPSINFLLPQNDFIESLRSAGFEMLQWQDVTDDCAQWFETVVTKIAQRPKTAQPPLGLNLIIGPSATEKACNTARNLHEHRIRVAYGVFRKSF